MPRLTTLALLHLGIFDFEARQCNGQLIWIILQGEADLADQVARDRMSGAGGGVMPIDR
jgi:hypothetical protein